LETVQNSDQRYRFVMASLIMFLFFGLALNYFAVSPVLKLILDEFPVGYGTASLLTGLVILVQLLVGIPAATLVGKYDTKAINSVGWLLIAAPVLTIFLENFWLILLSRLMIGLGFGIIGPAHVPVLMAWFKRREFIIMNSSTIFVTTLGIAISTAAAAPLAEFVGWRGALSLFGLTSFIGFAAWIILAKIPQSGRESIKEEIRPRDFIKIIRSKTVLVLANMDAVAFAQYSGLTTWLPLYYFEVHGIALIKTGLILGLMPLFAAMGIIAVGVLSFRFNRRKPFLYISGVMVGVGGFLSVIGAGTPWMYPGLLLVGTGSWLYVPVEMTIPMELPNATPRQATLTMGFLYTYSGLGGFIAPLGLGALTDLTGTYLLGFMILSAVSWFFFVGAFFLPETGFRKKLNMS